MTSRFIKKLEVLHLCGISNATLYRLIARGEFPIQRKLTGVTGRAVGWNSEEVNNWINSRPQGGC